jgi:hypothetical protein
MESNRGYTIFGIRQLVKGHPRKLEIERLNVRLRQFRNCESPEAAPAHPSKLLGVVGSSDRRERKSTKSYPCRSKTWGSVPKKHALVKGNSSAASLRVLSHDPTCGARPTSRYCYHPIPDCWAPIWNPKPQPPVAIAVGPLQLIPPIRSLGRSD